MANCGLCGVDVTFDMMQYYVPDFEGKKHRVCKACSVRAKDKALKYDSASGRIVVVDRSEIEIRKKCNVCGNVFCYNPVDVDNNKKKQSQAVFSALGSIGGAMSGHYAASAVHQGNINQAMGGIVDYDKCPKCGSMDLRVISKEELAAEMNYNRGQQVNASPISVADELKKFKELLDMGVITQEEFDQKKNECLHGSVQIAPQQKESEPVPAAQTVQSIPSVTETAKKRGNLPTILFWVITLLGIIKGYQDVYFSTRCFRAVYRGTWEFMVGHEEVSSAIFAALIWIVLSVFAGFIVGRIAANIQRKNG